MSTRRLVASIVIVVALLVVTPAAQAAPRWFINGKLAESKHEPEISYGKFEWASKQFGGTTTCQQFLAGSAWNEVKEGTERGFSNTVGYTTWECKSPLPCEVTNEAGVTKEGIFFSAEGPPSLTTEKARRSGNTSLPWTGELIEKEPETGKKSKYVLFHRMKIWLVVPVDEKLGGPGKGAGCELFGGDEIPWEEQEGPTEKEAGIELSPKVVNGLKNGLSPSKGVLVGEKSEKSGKPETGRLQSTVFGPFWMTGELVTTGDTDFELFTAE